MEQKVQKVQRQIRESEWKGKKAEEGKIRNKETLQRLWDKLFFNVNLIKNNFYPKEVEMQ